MSEEITIRPFRNEDLDSVIELERKVFGSIRSHEEVVRLWAWKVDGNPFSLSHIPCAWVLEQGGRIIGFEGQIAVPLKLGDKVVTAYSRSSFAVEEGHRGYGYGAKLASKFWRNREIPF